MNDTGVPNNIIAAQVSGPSTAVRIQRADEMAANSAVDIAARSFTSDQCFDRCVEKMREARFATSPSDTSGDHGPRRPRPPPVECGDLPFLIRRDGTWLYRGTPINRKEMVCLFASVLRRDADGGWWLQTPAERGRIQVEDAPFVAVELEWSGDGPGQVLSFRTNTDEVVSAGPAHPIRISHDIMTCEPTPYILIRPGAAPHLGIEARINRATYYELVALAVPRWIGSRRVLGVWSEGQFFSLGDLPPGEG